MSKLDISKPLEPNYFDQFEVGDVVYDSYMGAEWVVREKLENGMSLRINKPGGTSMDVSIDTCWMRFFKTYDGYIDFKMKFTDEIAIKRADGTSVTFDEMAESAAKKLCGNSLCIASYPCGHAKEAHCSGVSDPFADKAKDKTCPLARYDAYQAKSKPWYECAAEETSLSNNEIFALCARCENSAVHAERDKNGKLVSLGLTRTNLDDCLLCPVKAAEESMDECEAEM